MTTEGWSCSVVSNHVMNLCDSCDPISQPKMNIPYQTTTLNCLPFNHGVLYYRPSQRACDFCI